MPDAGTLAVFALAALALVAIPGPNHVFIVTRSIAQGRRAGYASACGVESGTLVHIVAAAAGVSALVASSAVAFGIVKWAGVAYLVFLGVQALRAADGPQLADSDADAAGDIGLRRSYLDGVLVNVLNPKVALFFLAFLPQFVDQDRAAGPQVVVLGLVLAAIGLASDLVYAAAAGTLGAWLRGRPGFWRRQRRVAGAVYLGLGAAAAITGRRNS